jgi:hypothetical protein
MSVIMSKTFTVPTTGQVEQLEPIEYVDSIVESAYINAINTTVMKKVRELSFEADIFGSSDVQSIMVETETDLNSKEDGYYVIDTSIRDADKNILTHSLTLYQRIEHRGTFFWSSYENRKLFEFYNTKCKRTVPHITKKPTHFQKFETELEEAVKGFKGNAERAGTVSN